ncbi:zinc peptidase [Cereibacter changlensis JA139]|uniref:Zinc peptidase n=2 Tax=Cereibacter changlensis TaxID=402884 RepID=A0A2T4JTL6_9RHOB|nr:zinc peptidase [Cereibacter changlensis JA139]
MKVVADAPLCPRELAEHLEVKIIRLTQLPPFNERELLLSRKAGCGFSAAACFEGLKAFIFLNDANDPKRQNSDIAHEIAHILLRHTPVNPFVPGGKREFSPEDELEAETLGPTLLVSEAAALRAYRLINASQHSLLSLSNEWMVTEDVIRWRMNAVGANKRARAAA